MHARASLSRPMPHAHAPLACPPRPTSCARSHAASCAGNSSTVPLGPSTRPFHPALHIPNRQIMCVRAGRPKRTSLCRPRPPSFPSHPSPIGPYYPSTRPFHQPSHPFPRRGWDSRGRHGTCSPYLTPACRMELFSGVKAWQLSHYNPAPGKWGHGNGGLHGNAACTHCTLACHPTPGAGRRGRTEDHKCMHWCMHACPPLPRAGPSPSCTGAPAPLATIWGPCSPCFHDGRRRSPASTRSASSPAITAGAGGAEQGGPDGAGLC